MKDTQKAFTLIELLMVIAISAIIMTFTMITYTLIVQTNDVNVEAQKIASTLVTAREQSLDRYNNSQYGVHFTTNSYTLFPGTTYSASNTSNQLHTVPADVSITSQTVDGSGDIVFNLMDGTLSSPTTSASITLATLVGSNTKTITVNAQGSVSIQ